MDEGQFRIQPAVLERASKKYSISIEALLNVIARYMIDRDMNNPVVGDDYCVHILGVSGWNIPPIRYSTTTIPIPSTVEYAFDDIVTVTGVDPAWAGGDVLPVDYTNAQSWNSDVANADIAGDSRGAPGSRWENLRSLHAEEPRTYTHITNPFLRGQRAGRLAGFDGMGATVTTPTSRHDDLMAAHLRVLAQNVNPDLLNEQAHGAWMNLVREGYIPSSAMPGNTTILNDHMAMYQEELQRTIGYYQPPNTTT